MRSFSSSRTEMIVNDCEIGTNEANWQQLAAANSAEHNLTLEIG
jgi:hypothetical protein